MFYDVGCEFDDSAQTVPKLPKPAVPKRIAVVTIIEQERRAALDWHNQRGFSSLRLGLREIERLGYLNLPIPQLATLPCKSPSVATGTTGYFVSAELTVLVSSSAQSCQSCQQDFVT